MEKPRCTVCSWKITNRKIKANNAQRCLISEPNKRWSGCDQWHVTPRLHHCCFLIQEWSLYNSFCRQQVLSKTSKWLMMVSTESQSDQLSEDRVEIKLLMNGGSCTRHLFTLLTVQRPVIGASVHVFSRNQRWVRMLGKKAKVSNSWQVTWYIIRIDGMEIDFYENVQKDMSSLPYSPTTSPSRIIIVIRDYCQGIWKINVVIWKTSFELAILHVHELLSLLCWRHPGY